MAKEITFEEYCSEFRKDPKEADSDVETVLMLIAQAMEERKDLRFFFEAATNDDGPIMKCEPKSLQYIDDLMAGIPNGSIDVWHDRLCDVLDKYNDEQLMAYRNKLEDLPTPIAENIVNEIAAVSMLLMWRENNIDWRADMLQTRH